MLTFMVYSHQVGKTLIRTSKPPNGGTESRRRWKSGAHAVVEWTWESLGRTNGLVAQDGDATVIMAEGIVLSVSKDCICE